MKIKLDGISAGYATFAAAEGLAPGVPVTLTANRTAGAAAAAARFAGVAKEVRQGLALVQLSGICRLPVSGAAPGVGYASLVADGSGGVRTASTGDTRPAIRPGRRQEMSTVMRAKRAAPTKRAGLALTTGATPLRRAVMTGTSAPPSSQPRNRPTGMPAALRASAWMRMMRRSWRGVVPMALRRP